MYDEFNEGIYDPQAIRSLLAYAYAHWSPKPVYVLLVGDASQDPKNNKGWSEPDLLPAYYTEALVLGQTPTDAWYVKVHGDDDYPDLIVGRIPARSASEVTTVANKVQRYEQSPPPGDWVRRAVLVADDGWVEFYKDMDAIANLLPAGVSPIKMYGYDPITSVQAEVNQGALLLAYSGHGGYATWGTWGSSDTIYNQIQMQSLSNGDKLPFMTAANCSSGYFATYNRPREMAEEFLLLDNKGGIASWAPASYGFPTVDTLMQQELYTAIFEDGETTLGLAATTARIQGLLQRPDLPLSLIEAFNYFGDPAVTLNVLRATLALAGQDLPDPVTMGNVLTFTLSYTVAGTSSRGLTLVDTLPEHVIYQSASPLPIVSGQVLTWSLGDMSPGSGAVKIVTQVKTNGLAHGQVLNNQARLYDADSEQVISLQTTVRDSPIVGLAVGNTSPTQLGNLTTLSATVAAGTNVAYTWNFGDGSPPSSGAQVHHTYPTIGAYTARAIATNGVSSQDQSTIVTITETPIAGLAASNNSPTQLGHLTMLSATITAGTDVIYTWDLGDGAPFQAGPYVQHTYPAIGDYIACVTATNRMNSQTRTTTVTITQVPIAGLAVSNSSPQELGSSIRLWADVITGTNVVYTWDVGDGTPPQTGASVEHVYPAVGDYTAYVTATNGASSQVQSTTVTVTDIPPIARFVSSSPNRQNQATLFQSFSAGTNLTYLWDFGDGSPPVSDGTALVTHTFAALGTFTTVLTASNRAGRSSVTGTVEIIVAVRPPVASFSSGSPDELGQATAFINTSQAGGDDEPTIVYAWDLGDGEFSSDKHPAHIYAASGSYTVQLTITNSVSSDTYSDTVLITDAPIHGLAAQNTSPTWLGNATALSATITAGTNVVYTWNLGDGSPPQTGAAIQHTYPAAGIFTAWVTATNGVSSQPQSTRVIIADVPIGSLWAGNDSPTPLGSPTTLSATIKAATGVTYIWDWGDGAPLQTGAQIQHTYSVVGTFSARVTAVNGDGSQSQNTLVSIIDVPIAGLSASNDSPTLPGHVTTLSATVTAGTNVVYTWNFADGSPPQTGDLVQHTYPAVGDYEAQVIATNGDSSQSQVTRVSVVDPTAVELLYFQAKQLSGQQVQLKWATALEVNNLGFNLYRANVNDLRLAGLPIHFEPAATQGSGSGAAYAYVDTAPYAGPWWYWLSDVDIQGRETLHTPININVQSNISLPYHVYFPFIAKGSGN